MRLSDDQRETLALAIARDRLKLILAVIREFAAVHTDDAYIEGRHLILASSSPGVRLEMIRDGMRAGRIVGRLGNAVVSKKYTDLDILVQLDDLVSVNGIEADRLEVFAQRVLEDKSANPKG